MMRKRFLFAAAALTVSLLAAVPALATPELAAFPIDRAKFLAGQIFDFEAELLGAQADDITVRINGKNAAEFFGATPILKKDAKASSYRINGVTLTQPGVVTVEAEAKAGGQTFKKTAHYTVVAPQKRQAQNVIFFIGDGMGLPSRQIARILSKGIVEGKYNGLLEMEELIDGTALLTTSGYDSLVTDSANSASAYATGHKSVLNAMGVYADSSQDHRAHPKVENLAEILKRAGGMSIGLVTTSNITDATPAAFVAHTRRRAEQNYIAEEMFKADVVMGGGSWHFLPQSSPGSRRKDNRDLIAEFKTQGYSLATTRTELAAAKSAKLLGLFNLDNMNVYLDREILKDPEVLGGFNQQPTLMEMTRKAIDVLSQNKNGFFLMVEGACIDKQLHAMDWQRSAYDTIEMDQAVKVAREFAARSGGSTLIIVTADHSHSVSITGTYHEKDGKRGREAVRTYAAAGFPSFEDKNNDGFPDKPDPEVTLAVQYANHPDYYEDFKFHPRPVSPTVMKDNVAVANEQRAPGGVLYQGNIPVREAQETHTADDVPLSAGGPGAAYFKGVMDNTEVFFAIVNALGVDPLKK